MARPTSVSSNSLKDEGVAFLEKMARPEGFEPPTPGSGNQCSIP